MKKCELCRVPASVYCESDEASLCSGCDVKVHEANFLVARHFRRLLCKRCQCPTPWKACGARLGNTETECDQCAAGNDEISIVNIYGGGGGGVGDQVEGELLAYDDEVFVNIDESIISSSSDNDEKLEEGEGENQQVQQQQLLMLMSTTATTATASSSSSTTDHHNNNIISLSAPDHSSGSAWASRSTTLLPLKRRRMRECDDRSTTLTLTRRRRIIYKNPPLKR